MYRQRPNENSLILPTSFDLIKYSDSNFARVPKDKKSIIRYYFILNKAMVF